MNIFIPETAPFTDEQRAWLNGFVAGMLGMERALATQGAQAAVIVPALPPATTEDEMPWHDPTLALDERMKLAEGRAIPLRLMAAMGQLDCGQCGYECRAYAGAIADGSETDIGKCVPGGRETAKKLKELLPLARSAAALVPAQAGAQMPARRRQARHRARLRPRRAGARAPRVVGRRSARPRPSARRATS